MFNIENLYNDKFLSRYCSYMLTSEYNELGRFINIPTLDILYNKLVKANYERIKQLPISKLTIYKTTDIGLGYINNISVKDIKKLVLLGKIDKNTKIYLHYKYGNVFSYINSEDIDKNILITDNTYLLVKEETMEIYLIKIGKLTNPNNLYYRRDLNDIVIKISELNTIPDINSIWIENNNKIL